MLDIDHSSYSQISTYLQCPKKYYYQYVEGVRDEEPQLALEYGTLVHETMEHYFNNNRGIELCELIDTYDAMFEIKDIPFENEEQKEDYYMAGLVAINGLSKPTNELEVLMNTLDVIGVEKEFSVEISGVNIIGFIDLVLQDSEGNIYIIDHKSSKKLFDKKKLNNDLQFPIYCLAVLQEYGKLPAKCYYNFTKLHDYQEVVVDMYRLNRSVEEIKDVFNKMFAKVFPPKPTALCFWCPCSYHKKNICEKSSRWCPK